MTTKNTGMTDGIKVLPMICYNQLQAIQYSLNSTQAIMMNYFSYVLPNFWEAKAINWKTYFWCSISKPLSDMPTLDISEGTLRENVRELIKRGLLLREVENNKPYYRPSDEWLLTEVSTIKAATNLKDKLKYMTEEEKAELRSLLWGVQAIEEKTTKTPTFDVGDIERDELMDLIINELLSSQKHLHFKALINEEWIMENILYQIKRAWSDTKWYKTDWEGYTTDDTRRIIKTTLKKMFDYYRNNNKPIKSMKGVINTFFWKDVLY